MTPHFEISDHVDASGKLEKHILIKCSPEDFKKYTTLIGSTFGAMQGAVDIRNKVQGGLSQLFEAAKMMGAKK